MIGVMMGLFGILARVNVEIFILQMGDIYITNSVDSEKDWLIN